MKKFCAEQIMTQQPALPPTPQRPAVMAGNEMVSSQPHSLLRIDSSSNARSDMRQSMPNSHKRRDPEVRQLFIKTYLAQFMR